jgi:hypothetical protein
MKTKINYMTPAAMILVLALGIVAGRADERENQRNAYAMTSLVSDLKGVCPIQDPVLQNAWGVAFTPAGRNAPEPPRSRRYRSFLDRNREGISRVRGNPFRSATTPALGGVRRAELQRSRTAARLLE